MPFVMLQVLEDSELGQSTALTIEPQLLITKSKPIKTRNCIGSPETTVIVTEKQNSLLFNTAIIILIKIRNTSRP